MIKPVVAPAPEPVAKPAAQPVVQAAPEPAKAPEPEQAPEPEPVTTAAPAATQQAMASGAYSAWLISFKDAAEARTYLQAAQARHPEIFAEAPGAVAAAKAGQGRFHRVLASGLSSHDAARDICRRLRAAEPGAFCKILAN